MTTALFMVALVARAAPAVPGPAAQRVVLLHALEDDALARQLATLLAAELKAAAFETIELDRDPRDEAATAVDGVWARLQPVAVLVVAGARSDGERVATIDLWIADPVTRQRAVRRIEVGGGARVSADLALKVVEILRGILLEVTIPHSAAPAPPALDLEQSARVTASPPPRCFTQGFGVAAGAGALGGTGVGASVAPVLRVSWGGAGGYAVRLAASGLGSVPEVRVAEGVARVRQSLIEVEGLRAFRAGSLWQPLVALGVGAYRVNADGTGVTTLFPADAGSHTAVAFSAQLGIALRLGARFALVTEAGLLALAPSTRILIAKREAARVGGASALATLSLFARF
ncbi:MAG TPA: hypothetical protein VFH68_01360 [Polyangia bacterium]|nr:hypothetical protein [Polyangia bacterium]